MSATGVAGHRPGERETIGLVATRALPEDSVDMEFLTDDPVAQAVTCQPVMFDAGHHAAAATAALVLGE